MKETVLYLIPSRSTFTEVDRRILANRYKVLNIELRQSEGHIAYVKGIVRMLLQLLCRSRMRKVFIWFADYHAGLAVFVCRLLRKRSVVFVGGYDAVCYPEFRYGVYYKRIRGNCGAYALRHCDLVIVNHQDLIRSINTYYRADGHSEGIKHFVPDLKTPVGVVHNGIETSNGVTEPNQREKTVLTVGGTPNLSDFYNKGYDLLIEVARRMPDLKFIFVGISPKCLRHYDPIYGISRLSNISVYHYLEHDELMDLYSRVQVYAQPSISEGMPNSLMEAMLMGCIPVGSNVAGIPTLIGDSGFIIMRRSADDLSRAVEQALNAEDHACVSRRIRECFGADKRKDGIFDLLQRHFGSV